MKITIEKNELAKQVNNVIGAIGDSKSMQILSHLLLSVNGDVATLSATDLEIEVCATFTVAGEQDGAIAVPGKKFHEIVKELPNGDVTISVDETNSQINISAGKARFNICGLTDAEFPALKKAETESLVPFKPEGFSQFLSQVKHAICNDETKHNLNGVYLHRSGTSMLAVATNGHRLSRTIREKELPENFLPEKGIIIPKKAVLEICKLADNAASGDDILVACKDNNFQVMTGNIRLAARLIDADYPDYNRVIPSEGGTIATISKQYLAQALKRITVVTEGKDQRAKLVFSENQINISANGATIGDATEEFQIGYTGQPAEVHLNARYALEALSALEKDKEEEFRMTIHEGTKPVLLESIKAGFLAVIMPMRA